jgi:hypothetical protein
VTNKGSRNATDLTKQVDRNYLLSRNSPPDCRNHVQSMRNMSEAFLALKWPVVATSGFKFICNVQSFFSG